MVSIYVNPLQFGINEDLDTYPRTWEDDLKMLVELDHEFAETNARIGMSTTSDDNETSRIGLTTSPSPLVSRSLGRISAVFAPTTKTMYPTLPPTSDNGTFVTVTPLASLLEGASRPVFFRGVATVCMKLFNIVDPDKVYFGQKDVQQTVIIKRMVKDLCVPVEMVIGPTMREEDGLAMSSRNIYLGQRRRQNATILVRTLRIAEEQYLGGKLAREDILGPAQELLGSLAGAGEQEQLAAEQRVRFEVDYLSLADTESLEEVGIVDETKGAILSGAIKMLPIEKLQEGEDDGKTLVRLIDNIILKPRRTMSDPRAPPTPTSAPDLDILGDQVKIHPGGYLEPPAKHDDTHERNLVENMARFRQSPFDFLREVSLYVSGTGWRAYDDVVGQPILYSGYTDRMKAAVMSTPILQEKISELAERRLAVEETHGLLGLEDKEYVRIRALRKAAIEQSLQEVADELTDKMICKFESKRFIRGAYYLCTQLLTRAYHQVGQFLQHAGAMYIRRSFGNDALYTTLVQSYIDTLLKNGYNFECFIEGGRSRTGKLLPPKFGILSFILDTILSGRVEDAIICPVSTQYDKVIETEGYVNELLGVPKKRENLMDFLSASSVLSLKLGRVDVRFHEPWSLKNFIEQQSHKFADTQQINAQNTTPDIRVRILSALGYKVLSDINAVSVVMPTALIGTVLLTLRGRGVGKSELVRRVNWLSGRIQAKGGRVAHFAGAPTSAVVERGIEVLGPDLVGVVEGLPEETFYAIDRFQLSFYRNMTIHLFVSEALISAGMYTKVKLGGGPEHQRVTYRALLNQVSFLSQLFRGEFIFPAGGLSVNLENTLNGLEKDGVIEIRRGGAGGIKTVELSDAERICGRENYDFYCFLIWPFIEASWLGAVSLVGLTPLLGQKTDVWLEVKRAQDMAQLLGKTLYHQGDLSYFEAVNKEILKNAFQRFEEEGIIVTRKSRGPKHGPSTMKVADKWMLQRDPDTGKVVPEGRLWDFIEMIARSRRGG
ncbi:hypothetical protein FGG08_000348 [Glutinoglossum americanum]|uniref:Pantoate--beta-alanine ligase n=1 Tax=Glutinoglossum americanum TaxID=1670608 RepID=A0A9P8L1B1_9PEZI|nr:hypothetical protein FGG08_000348 [Glutinoglossum americanum]